MVELMTNGEKRAERKAFLADRLAKARAARGKNLGGRPKGKKNPATLEKEKEKKALDQVYLRAQRRLSTAQITIATGVSFLYRIDKKKITGPKGGIHYENQKPELVVSQYEIEHYLTELADNNGDISDNQDPEAAYYFITTKEPNNEAIKDILNRVHGKPTETQEVNVNQTFSLLNLGQKRQMINGNSDVVEVKDDELLPAPNTLHEE